MARATRTYAAVNARLHAQHHTAWMPVHTSSAHTVELTVLLSCSTRRHLHRRRRWTKARFTFGAGLSQSALLVVDTNELPRPQLQGGRDLKDGRLTRFKS